MGDIKNLNSTAVYAWTTLISVFICVPAALIMEGPRLRLAVDALANSHPNFYFDLFTVGLLYHLYNQVRRCTTDMFHLQHLAALWCFSCRWLPAETRSGYRQVHWLGALTFVLCFLQFAFNTLSRVTPVAHGVCNVVKRVCIIGTSVIFFGNRMTDQTKIGTVIALIGEHMPWKVFLR